MQAQRGLCGLYISQSPHSIFTHSCAPVWACHLTVSTVSLSFRNTYLYVHTHTHTHVLSSCWLSITHKYKHTCQLVLSKKKKFLATELLTLDSPVLCWTGCWGTVSLLALCPMLRLLSPLACWALPLQRPAAGEENLKLPRFPLARHRAPVSQGCTVRSLTSFSLSHLSCLALPLPSSLCYLVDLSLSSCLLLSLQNTNTLTCSVLKSLPSRTSWLHK